MVKRNSVNEMVTQHLCNNVDKPVSDLKTKLKRETPLLHIINSSLLLVITNSGVTCRYTLHYKYYVHIFMIVVSK